VKFFARKPLVGRNSVEPQSQWRKATHRLLRRLPAKFSRVRCLI